MDYELKHLFNQYADMIEMLMSDSGEFDEFDDLSRLIKFELARFAMYLSCSDGEITWEETQFISDYLDFTFTPESLKEFVNEENIYSTDFEASIPPSLTTAVAVDNLMIENNVIGDSFSSDIAITIYRTIADQLMNADGFESASERFDADTYIDGLEQYVRENRLDMKKSVKVPSKKVTVKVGKKKGVVAPEKK